MKAVAAQALVVIFARQCKGIIHPRMGTVERGIEAADLDGFGKCHMRGCYSGQIVRLVQGSEWHELFKVGNDILGEDNRFGVIRTAMDNAVPDRKNIDAGDMSLEHVHDVEQGFHMLAGPVLRKHLVLDHLSGARFEDAMRCGVECFDLSFCLEHRTPAIQFEQREFQRG